MISHVKKGKKTHRGKRKENEKMEKSVCEGAACNNNFPNKDGATSRILTRCSTQQKTATLRNCIRSVEILENSRLVTK
jgi:hypothetical protein